MLHNECFAYAAIFLGSAGESLETNFLEIMSCVATTPRCARVRNTDLSEEKEVFRIPLRSRSSNSDFPEGSLKHLVSL